LGNLTWPVRANWRTERVGKPDSTAYIQNLINTNGIAELPEGVFYISSTLLLPIDNAAIKQGIQGKGTGKTVIWFNRWFSLNSNKVTNYHVS
jgi:hypothetical protein